jgi:internalin A
MDLTALSSLQDLQRLDLSWCSGVMDLRPLSGLQGLQYLNLYGCELYVPIDLLRSLITKQHLEELFVDKAVGVPREVLSRDFVSDNCLTRLHSYFGELDLAPEAENEVKVILLGNGRVGKTQLCRRFREEPFDDSVPSTHGVQIWRKELRLRTGGEEQVFQINWWDFGGQDIYHGTHALFLRSRAVFLILWKPELENQGEYEENGVSLRNQPLTYWLDYVWSLAGESSPVIVVQSQCDGFANQLSVPPRPKGFDFLQYCAYSAKTDHGRDPLEAQLREAIRYLLDRTGTLQIGRGRAEVRRRLYQWRAEDQKRRPEERRHRTLTLQDFQTLCNEVGEIVSWEHTSITFTRRGWFSTIGTSSRTASSLIRTGRSTPSTLSFIVAERHPG